MIGYRCNKLHVDHPSTVKTVSAGVPRMASVRERSRGSPRELKVRSHQWAWVTVAQGRRKDTPPRDDCRQGGQRTSELRLANVVCTAPFGATRRPGRKLWLDIVAEVDLPTQPLQEVCGLELPRLQTRMSRVSAWPN
jgi:hypothetical protein